LRVYTFIATVEDCPVPVIGRIRCFSPAQGKRKAGEDWHPVVFTGENEDAVRRTAEAWWAAELAKAEAASRRGANLRKPATASDAPAADSMDDAELIVL